MHGVRRQPRPAGRVLQRGRSPVPTWIWGLSASDGDPDLLVAYFNGIALHRHGGVLEAVAVAQTEVLLLERAGDPELTLVFTYDAARQHVGGEEGISVVDGEYLGRRARAEQGDLAAFKEGTNTGSRQDVVELAGKFPPLISTSSWMNWLASRAQTSMQPDRMSLRWQARFIIWPPPRSGRRGCARPGWPVCAAHVR